jgi:hypothetical protein
MTPTRRARSSEFRCVKGSRRIAKFRILAIAVCVAGHAAAATIAHDASGGARAVGVLTASLGTIAAEWIVRHRILGGGAKIHVALLVLQLPTRAGHTGRACHRDLLHLNCRRSLRARPLCERARESKNRDHRRNEPNKTVPHRRASPCWGRGLQPRSPDTKSYARRRFSADRREWLLTAAPASARWHSL